jgi:pre-mRNA-splicing factor SYF1
VLVFNLFPLALDWQTHFILPEYLMQKDQKLTVEEAVDTLKRAGVPEDQMGALERQLVADSSSNATINKDSSARSVNFVCAGVVEPEPDTTKKAVANAEEIDLPESDSDDENIEIAQKSVPAAVFGELAKKAAEEQEGEDDGAAASESRLGALERIKRQRQQ